jgi:uncharacterized protein YuzE
MKISYDDQHDVMYIVFADTDSECNYIELESGDILRIDLKTNEIVGCTIMDFLKRMRKQKTLSIPTIAEVYGHIAAH